MIRDGIVHARCNICGLGYVSTHGADVKLHNRMHKQWIDVTEQWAVNPVHTTQTYERDKARYRTIFHSKRHPLHIKTEAAIKYLHVQWKERGLWSSVRYNSYAQFVKKYPDIPTWIRDNYHTFKHEFSEDIQQAVCKRYNIPYKQAN